MWGNSMNCKNAIIWRIANKECDKITRKIILYFQKMTDCLMSGDDSGLKNTWDEICVQVQGEKFISWDIYFQEIHSRVQYEVEKLGIVIKQAIWLQTEEGIEWEDGEEEDYNQLAICENDIVEYIVNEFVLAAAVNYNNTRIENFIWG